MKLIHALLPTLLATAGISNAQTIHNHQKKETMSTIQHNEAIVRSVYEQALNKRNFGSLKTIVSDEYSGFQGIKGPEGFSKPVEGLIKAFPDIQWNIEDVLGEDNKVAIRWQWRGTHKGAFNGYAPTGKTITNDGMAIFELKDGKITGSVLQTDRLGFWQEIDVLPADPAFFRPGQTGAGKPGQGAAQQPAQARQEDTTRPVHKSGISLIDKFFVPAAAKAEFYERMHFNRQFLTNMPGLIRQDAYEYTDHDGNLICVTIAEWESKEVIEKAKEAVQAEYKREGVDLPAILKRLNITMDRGIYREVSEQ